MSRISPLESKSESCSLSPKRGGQVPFSLGNCVHKFETSSRSLSYQENCFLGGCLTRATWSPLLDLDVLWGLFLRNGYQNCAATRVAVLHTKEFFDVLTGLRFYKMLVTVLVVMAS